MAVKEEKRMRNLGLTAPSKIITPPDRSLYVLLSNGHAENIGGFQCIWKRGDVVELTATAAKRLVNKVRPAEERDGGVSLPEKLGEPIT